MLARRWSLVGCLVVLGTVAACGSTSSPPPGTGSAGPRSSAPSGESSLPASPGPATAATPMPPASLIAGWTKFSPADGSFEIQMPGLATELKTEIATTTGSIPYTMEMVMRPGSVTGFIVAWADYPAATAANLKADPILAASQANDLAGVVGGTVTNQAQVTFVGHPGRAWTVKFPTGTVESRAYLVGARAYLLKVVSGSGDDPSLAQTFFDSFRVAP